MKLFGVLLLLISAVLCEKVSNDFVLRNNQFTISVLKELGKDHEKNVVFSAFSLETVLSLIALGAKGKTAETLKTILQLPKSNEEIKNIFKKVHAEINQVDQVEIISANQVYLGENCKIEEDFNKTATEIFNAGVKNINFNDATKSSEEINKWVEEITKNKIKNLIKADQINELTKLILVNALYFKGSWVYPFKPSLTTQRYFQKSADEIISVDTMKVTANIYVHRNPKYRHVFLRIPYLAKDHRATLTIVVPDDVNEFRDLERNLTHAVPEQNYTREYSTLYLPKFKVEATTDLKAILEKLGVDLFNNPDLSGITKEPVKVGAIQQKVFISVDEHGTEAAAATQATITKKSGLPRALNEYHVNRPFFFCLQYDEVALLTGRIINPLEGKISN